MAAETVGTLAVTLGLAVASQRGGRPWRTLRRTPRKDAVLRGRVGCRSGEGGVEAAPAPDVEAEAPKAKRAKPAAKPAPRRAPAPPRRPPNKEFDPADEIGVTEPLGFWDPVGLCPKDETVFNEYRACEIKHGRVAMLASLGAVVQHYIHFPGFDKNNFGEPMPNGIAALWTTPASFGFVLLLIIIAGLELALWKDGVDGGTGKWAKEPGNFGDPLGIGQYTDDMRNRELNNGRMAMITAMGIIGAEVVTGKDAVQQLGL